MDGIHDLGGRQGFGPVDRSHEDEPYHGDDDARAYGVSMSLRATRPFSIDWFRHVRELIDPVDYLTRPYFDSWLQTALALSIDAGDVEMAEAISARARGEARVTAVSPETVRSMVRTPVDFERPSNTAPRFAPGSRVRTAAQGHSGHTRLPAYARNAIGSVLAHRGAHPLPDAAALGEEKAEHLYTVVFRATDLFPEIANEDEITLDLWESYLNAE